MSCLARKYPPRAWRPARTWRTSSYDCRFPGMNFFRGMYPFVPCGLLGFNFGGTAVDDDEGCVHAGGSIGGSRARRREVLRVRADGFGGG